MEIKNSLLNNLDPYAKNRVGQTDDTAERAVGQTSSATSPRGDRVSLSDEARVLTAIRAEVAAAPDLRREKVDALKQSVADGTYTVYSKKVAQRLLTTESLLASTLDD